MEAQPWIDAIVREPEEDGHWLVYADWLLEHADTRGELITLGLAEQSDEARKRIRMLEGDEARLLSPRLFEQSHFWQFEWRRGFLHGATLGGAMDDPPTAEAIEAVFADPHAGLLHRLDLSMHDNDEIFAPVTAAIRSWLSALKVSGRVTDAGGLAAATPKLRYLSVDDWSMGEDEGDGLTELVHPGIVELDAYGCVALQDHFELTSLQTLRWSSDGMFLPTSILYHPPPRLVDLELGAEGAMALERLPDATVLSQLRSLALGAVDGRCLETLLLARSAAFAHLEHLRVAVFSATPRWPEAEVVTLRTALERALPRTKLSISWGSLGPVPPQPPEPL